jgi:hypothetical protein
MGIEETSQAPPGQQGEQVDFRTFIPETPHMDKGKSTTFQTPPAGATSQTQEAQMQQMAREIEALKRKRIPRSPSLPQRSRQSACRRTGVL